MAKNIRGPAIFLAQFVGDAAPFDAFAPPQVHGKPKERQQWAVEQVMYGAQASRNLGLDAHVTFCGALAWPFLYPWPQRPTGMIDMAFEELGRRWAPILNAYDAE